jgi:hypothetical protein
MVEGGLSSEPFIVVCCPDSLTIWNKPFISPLNILICSNKF